MENSITYKGTPSTEVSASVYTLVIFGQALFTPCNSSEISSLLWCLKMNWWVPATSSVKTTIRTFTMANTAVMSATKPASASLVIRRRFDVSNIDFSNCNRSGSGDDDDNRPTGYQYKRTHVSTINLFTNKQLYILISRGKIDNI